MDIKIIIMHIKQVRSEMRFYSGKPMPDFNLKKANEVMDRFVVNKDLFQRRLKTSATGGLQRQQIMRELTKLKVDLDLFVKERKRIASDKPLPTTKKIPVIHAVTLLCDKLGSKPIKRLF